MPIEHEDTETPVEKTCPQCGQLIPPQKTGRRRKYCSQSCRQHAYEERNGLLNWREQRQAQEAKAKVERAYRHTEYEKARRLTHLLISQGHDSHEHVESCIDTIRSYELALAEVLEWVSYLVLDDLISKTAKGEHLSQAIEQLVSDVRLAGFQAAPVEDLHNLELSTTPQKTGDYPPASRRDLKGGKP